MLPSRESTCPSLPIVVLMVSMTLSVPMAHAGATTHHEFGGHVYLIVNEPESWAAADVNAELGGGHLATVESEAENQFLYANLLSRAISTTAPDGGGARYAWLGGSDAAQEGIWRWVNGNVMSAGYTKWGSGSWGTEPDDYNRAQDHLALGLEGWPVSAPGGMGNASEWNDVNGQNSLAYVIEYDSPDRDTDGDGISDWQEFISGTDPTDGSSVLQLRVRRSGNDGVVLSWEGADKCSYSVETRGALFESDWVTVIDLQGVDTPMSYTNASSATPLFFRIRVER